MSLRMWQDVKTPSRMVKQHQGLCQLKQQEAQSFNETDYRMTWKSPEIWVGECLVYEYSCGMQSAVME